MGSDVRAIGYRPAGRGGVDDTGQEPTPHGSPRTRIRSFHHHDQGGAARSTATEGDAHRLDPLFGPDTDAAEALAGECRPAATRILACR